jgi:hypothetical protein
MRQMKNVRTGNVAAYDEELVQSGRWVEVVKEEQPAPEKRTAKKAVKLPQIRATGSLEVKSNESQ